MPTDTVPYAGLTQLPLAEHIFGSTGAMEDVRKSLEEAVHDDLPVLIEGESGTGKELMARYFHSRSHRAAAPFERVNCGAIDARLLDREFFERNETAGTLFLDEIGEMDSASQRRVGRALKAVASLVRARIVCASSIDMTGTADKRVSEDLLSHFRHRMRLVPLRERKQDIPRLCEYLAYKFARDFGRPTPRLNAFVLESLQQRSWPGNIRELENWIARIVVFGTEEAMSQGFRRQVSGQAGECIARPHGVRLSMGPWRRSRRSS